MIFVLEFYQVCYYLMVGQVKSVKTVLKQLQQSIQTVTSAGWPSDEEMVPSNVADNFQWLTKDHLCILVYLVTVMHSMQVRGFKKICGFIYITYNYIPQWVQILKISAKKKILMPTSRDVTLYIFFSSQSTVYCNLQCL